MQNNNIGFFCLILLLIGLYFIYEWVIDDIKYREFVKNLEIGDTFNVTISERNPFSEDLCYVIEIVDIKSSFVQYKSIHNDGSSRTDYDDLYSFYYHFADDKIK